MPKVWQVISQPSSVFSKSMGMDKDHLIDMEESVVKVAKSGWTDFIGKLAVNH